MSCWQFYDILFDLYQLSNLNCSIALEMMLNSDQTVNGIRGSDRMTHCSFMKLNGWIRDKQRNF